VEGQPFYKLFFNGVNLVLKDDRYFSRDGGKVAVLKDKGFNLWYLSIIND
jgi:hypothetical protein